MWLVGKSLEDGGPGLCVHQHVYSPFQVNLLDLNNGNWCKKMKNVFIYCYIIVVGNTTINFPLEHLKIHHQQLLFMDSTTVNYTTYFAFSTSVFSLSPCVNTSDLKELCRSLPIKYQKITFSINILSLLIPLIVILWFSRLLSFSYRQLSFIMLLIPVSVTVKTPMICLWSLQSKFFCQPFFFGGERNGANIGEEREAH